MHIGHSSTTNPQLSPCQSPTPESELKSQAWRWSFAHLHQPSSRSASRTRDAKPKRNLIAINCPVLKSDSGWRKENTLFNYGRRCCRVVVQPNWRVSLAGHLKRFGDESTSRRCPVLRHYWLARVRAHLGCSFNCPKATWEWGVNFGLFEGTRGSDQRTGCRSS